MSYVVVDNESEIPLYGIVLLLEHKRTQKPVEANIYKVPAEAWIAFLMVRYQHVPEVQTYLKAVDNGEGINPRQGALLQAIDERCEIPEEEFLHGMKLCGGTLLNDEEGEEWKHADD